VVELWPDVPPEAVTMTVLVMVVCDEIISILCQNALPSTYLRKNLKAEEGEKEGGEGDGLHGERGWRLLCLWS
jgi:hypothetical protein